MSAPSPRYPNPLLDTSRPMFSFAGKRALVTGGGRGIGRATALALARQGADVTVVSRTVAELEGVAQEIRGFGRRAWVIEAALDDRPAAVAMVAAADAQMEGIDILVNNAGGGGGLKGGVGPLRDLTPEAFDGVYGLNLRAPFFAALAVAERMAERGQGGSIVNVASIDGVFAAPGEAVYGSAKAALVSLTETMSVEYGTHGVRVNAVAPSLINTRLVSRHLQTADQYQARASFFPINRVGEPEDVAAAIVFLCSDEAVWISGVTIKVAGGQQATSDIFRWVRRVNPVPDQDRI